MLESLFGSRYIERVLFFLLVNHTCYGTQLSKRLKSPLTPVQRALERLEHGGVIVSHLVGKTRVYQFNPRYPFLDVLIDFLRKAYVFLPETIRQEYYETPERKRPRKKGKPI